MITWQWALFDQLSLGELYAILKIRQQVFIVEQDCPYLDADGLDQSVWHLCCWQQDFANKELVAYLRVLPPGMKYSEAALGRVLTAESVRGSGIGKELIRQGLKRTQQQYPDTNIRISAQLYLEKFYTAFGFETVSEPYHEDGIPHIEMLNKCTEIVPT
jgi:ElaA protein